MQQRKKPDAFTQQRKKQDTFTLNVDDYPQEVLLYLIDFLDIQTLSHLSCVNHFFHTLCKDKINAYVPTVFDLISTQNAFIKIIESPLSDHNDPQKDMHWHFLLDQLADPESFRPVSNLYAFNLSHKFDLKTATLKPRTGKNNNKTSITVRGQITWQNRPKIGAEYIKKTSATLLPPDSRIQFFEATHPIGILFDLRHCDTKRLEEKQQIWRYNAGTNNHWWYQAKDANTQQIFDDYRKNAPTISLQELREINAKVEVDVTGKRIIPKHNECMPRFKKEAVSAVFATSADKISCLNALAKKYLVKAKLGIDLPVLVITPEDGVTEYTQTMQAADIEETLFKSDSKDDSSIAVKSHLKKDLFNPKILDTEINTGDSYCMLIKELLTRDHRPLLIYLPTDLLDALLNFAIKSHDEKFQISLINRIKKHLIRHAAATTFISLYMGISEFWQILWKVRNIFPELQLETLLLEIIKNIIKRDLEFKLLTSIPPAIWGDVFIAAIQHDLELAMTLFKDQKHYPLSESHSTSAFQKAIGIPDAIGLATYMINRHPSLLLVPAFLLNAMQHGQEALALSMLELAAEKRIPHLAPPDPEIALRAVLSNQESIVKFIYSELPFNTKADGSIVHLDNLVNFVRFIETYTISIRPDAWIDAFAEVIRKNKKPQTVYHLLTKNKLFEKFRCDKDETLLLLAIENKNDELAMLLIERGANINGKKDQHSFFKLTIQNGCKNTYACMLADPQLSDEALLQGLCAVTDLGPQEYALDILEKIKSRQLAISSYRMEGTLYDALHCAIYRGNVELTTAFCQSGADVTAKNKSRQTAVDMAIATDNINNIKMMQALLVHAKNIASAQVTAIVKNLLTKKAGNLVVNAIFKNNPQISESTRTAAAWVALKQKIRPLTELLITQGVNTSDRKDKDSVFILTAALEANFDELVLTQLNNPHLALESLDEIVLQAATQDQTIVALRALEKIKAHVINKTGTVRWWIKTKNNALHHAVINGNLLLVEKILEFSQKFHSTNLQQQTPLDIALEQFKSNPNNNNIEIIKLILKNYKNLTIEQNYAIFELFFNSRLTNETVWILNNTLLANNIEALYRIINSAVQQDNETIAIVAINKLKEQKLPAKALNNPQQITAPTLTFRENPFYYAAQNGNVRLIKALFEVFPPSLSEHGGPNGNFSTTYIVATQLEKSLKEKEGSKKKDDYAEILRLLLLKNEMTAANSPMYEFAFHVLIEAGYISHATEILIANHRIRFNGSTIFSFAILHRANRLARLLLQRGANLPGDKHVWDYPLSSDDDLLVQAMLQHPSLSITHLTYVIDTLITAYPHKEDLILFALKVAYTRHFPLLPSLPTEALVINNPIGELATLLILLEFIDVEGDQSLFRLACETQPPNLKLARLLVEKGADVNTPVDIHKLETLLDHPEFSALLNTMLKSEGMKEESVLDSLLQFAKLNKTELALQILEKVRSCNYNIATWVDVKTEDSALHYAVRNGNSLLVKKLCESGSNVCSPNLALQTPLDVALAQLDSDPTTFLPIIRLLLADTTNIASKTYTAAFKTLLEKGYVVSVCKIIEKNPTLSFKGHSELLHLAIARGKESLAKLLIKRGADMNGENNHGQDAFKRTTELKLSSLSKFMIKYTCKHPSDTSTAEEIYDVKMQQLASEVKKILFNLESMKEFDAYAEKLFKQLPPKGTPVEAYSNNQKLIAEKYAAIVEFLKAIDEAKTPSAVIQAVYDNKLYAALSKARSFVGLFAGTHSADFLFRLRKEFNEALAKNQTLKSAQEFIKPLQDIILAKRQGAHL